MRFIVMVRATKDSESGALPDPKVFQDMSRFNEELAKAGVLLAGEGLHPSSNGARLQFSGDSRTVVDGPFAETKELIAGFWMWKVKSRDEALEWLKLCPHPFPGQDAVIELRQVFELDDFSNIPSEVIEQEERLRAEIENSSKRKAS